MAGSNRLFLRTLKAVSVQMLILFVVVVLLYFQSKICFAPKEVMIFLPDKSVEAEAQTTKFSMHSLTQALI